MKKRGTHVGIVLSFVIFITFLVFLYSIVEPVIRVQRDKESLLDYLRIELIRRFSANLTTATISITTEGYSTNCVNLVYALEETGINERIIVKDNQGNFVKTNISNQNYQDIIINRESIEEDFFKIYA